MHLNKLSWNSSVYEAVYFQFVQVDSGPDPVSKVRGAIQEYLAVNSRNGFTTVREMKYASQYCCVKTMNCKLALYRECCFPNCTNHGEKS